MLRLITSEVEWALKDGEADGPHMRFNVESSCDIFKRRKRSIDKSRGLFSQLKCLTGCMTIDLTVIYSRPLLSSSFHFVLCAWSPFVFSLFWCIWYRYWWDHLLKCRVGLLITLNEGVKRAQICLCAKQCCFEETKTRNTKQTNTKYFKNVLIVCWELNWCRAIDSGGSKGPPTHPTPTNDGKWSPNRPKPRS